MNLQVFHELLLNQPLLVLFITIAIGLLIGRCSIKGIHLGSSGVLFSALLAGHLGYSIPTGVGTLGLVLFVYCVGIAPEVVFLHRSHEMVPLLPSLLASL
ncbi:MAG: Putative transport protein YbjL [Opitutia bacterium UBA7350]|nr:MAG: Putative transport protein YbjL [Opitutae bacterium UBA7350]